MKNVVIKSIRAYKKISAFLWAFRPPFVAYSSCKFYPTCSDYTIDAVSKFGVVKGVIKGAGRIIRCNPFSKGGVDLA